MSFGFGSSGQSAFGSTPNKPTAFAAPLTFGTPATTTASAGFGSYGSFGTPAQQPTFGSTFGQQTATPAFGQPSATPSFGQSSITPAFGQQSATPAFGQQATASVFGQQQVPAPAFGQQSTTPAFGQQTQTAGFGQPSATPSFGQPSAAPAFGQQSTTPAFGNTFGQSGTAAPAFGQAASATPTFGSTFGATATSAPAFGGTFGAPATTAPSLFGSLQTNKPSLFGTPAASTTPSLFGTTTTTAGGLFGSTSAPTGGLFGSSTTTQAPSLFGSTAASTPSLFGTSSTAPPLFASAIQPTGGGLFGSTTTTQPSLFGSATAPQFSLGSGAAPATTTTSTGFSFFGPTTTTAPSLFGGLGTTTTTQSGFGGFGSTFTGFGSTAANATPFGATTFGQKPFTATAQTAAPVDKNQQVLASIYAINVFGDERDNVLKKWNMLQACWGTGKGYYSQNQPPIEYDHSNQFYRFKAVGYTVIPNAENLEGLVKLIFNKKESELKNQKDVLIKGLSGILGNKPNLTVEIETIKNLDGNRSEVTIIVSEKGATGQTRKIPATDLSSFLNQPMNKQQLTNVGVTNIFPYVTPTKAQIEEYLKNPGPGVDPTMWQMAQIDNPNPNKYLPTVINGFTDLKKRMLTQEYETGLHRAFLAKVIREMKEVKSKHTASLAQIAEMKQKFLALQHRTLRILVKQECTRKVGMALQPEEEMLRARLEAMHAQLGIPNQYRGLLNELLSYVKLTGGFVIPKENYRIDSSALDDIKQFLKMQQNGISQLVNIINLDMEALKTINEGLKELSKYQPKI